MRHDNFIPHPQFVRIRSRGRLPHWEVDAATYFVTFRLRDSLPREIARNLYLERERMFRHASTDAERTRLDQAFGIRLDQFLDTGYGSCILRDYGDLMATALKYRDGTEYDLQAWCVMPNHVHVMFYVERGKDVPKILHSWKGYVAHEIRGGVIWQREYFDRVVRSPREFSDTAAYIRANPAKAGLRNWKWVG